MNGILLLKIGISLLFGLLMSRIAKKVSLPAVTAYLVTGVILGPYLVGKLNFSILGFNTQEQLESLKIINDTALGFIAFAIGNEFRLSQLRNTGKQATIIGIIQALSAAVFVDIVLICIHILFPNVISLSSAIVLGAVATATAPAATLMVVQQYKSRGPLTDLLLPIVALDDAVGLIVFSISFGIAKAIQTGKIDMISIIVEPILEILFSLLLGIIMSIALTYLERFFHSRSKRLALALTFVFITVGICSFEFNIFGINISFSSLLTCMMLGTIFCNICNFSEELMERCDRWTAPLFILFFILSGAELNLTIFSNYSIIIIGIIFILFRSLGKYLGTYFSAKISKCDKNTTKYLGITLLPQAGVALGMAVSAMELGQQEGSFIRNIILFSVLVYELIGPLLTKMALTAAGEIDSSGKKSARIQNK